MKLPNIPQEMPKSISFFLRWLAWIFIALLLIVVIVIAYFMSGSAKPAQKIEYGVTFSQLFAEQLGLDWRAAYIAILDDLKVRKLRLIAYWPKIETEKDKYVFDDLDWQIDEAQKRGVEIILAMGKRVPRWPECHVPLWAKDLSTDQQQKEILFLLTEIVARYQKKPAIKYWQVENEPFLKNFGECPNLDKEFLDLEIELVKSMDSRPIILTTSGELSSWIGPASRTKILGTTLYRTVWSRYFGYIRYPIAPVFYQKRANLVKRFFGVEKVFVCELGAEPWGPKQIYESAIEEQFYSMNVEEFKKNLDYIKKTGLDEFYFWGAEWWFWLKTQNEAGMWAEAKKLWAIQ